MSGGKRMPWYLPFLSASVLFLLGVATDRTIRAVSDNTWLALADELVLCVILGCVVLRYERRRELYLEARLRVIREMNHHVRNALQVISYTTVKQSDQDVNRMLRESVTRIDWALREVLPGDKAGEEPSKTTVE